MENPDQVKIICNVVFILFLIFGMIGLVLYYNLKDKINEVSSNLINMKDDIKEIRRNMDKFRWK